MSAKTEFLMKEKKESKHTEAYTNKTTMATLIAVPLKVATPTPTPTTTTTTMSRSVGLVSSDAAQVREFTAGAGQPTPDVPEPMSKDAVLFLTKMILDETVSGWVRLCLWC